MDAEAEVNKALRRIDAYIRRQEMQANKVLQVQLYSTVLYAYSSTPDAGNIARFMFPIAGLVQKIMFRIPGATSKQPVSICYSVISDITKSFYCTSEEQSTVEPAIEVVAGDRITVDIGEATNAGCEVALLFIPNARTAAKTNLDTSILGDLIDERVRAFNETVSASGAETVESESSEQSGATSVSQSETEEGGIGSDSSAS